MTSQTLNKPAWAGDDWLSRLVNQLIQTPFLYRVMKQQARRVMIRTAERNGIPWRDRVAALETSDVKALADRLTNANVTYPDYYNVPFHAYDEGNLCWLAAFEAEPATYAMALRVTPKENLSPDVAYDRLRTSFYDIVDKHLCYPVRDVLDVGCSIGMSTRSLHRYLRSRQSEPANIIGLDLSPQMLAVAQHLDSDNEIDRWVHGLAEATEFPDNSFDLVTLQFILHELPNAATEAIFKEARRILRPGGIIAIADNNPKSKVIQNLPPALFVLMKSTEPWSDEYYTFDVEATLQKLGFEHLETAPSDPRHRAIVARA
ncbi:class I SAM-dependent methyltransferase [Baaleninema simplex]|uniref:class I SAM-dependent methyltransferase n=1 Tax=Baaleninema simplex TaxID=2862350 RepID=UPI00034C61DE|nr:class I SAM-dependent methyltransferase [Baaleninema simplex]